MENTTYKIKWSKLSSEIYNEFRANVKQHIDEAPVDIALPVLDDEGKEVEGYQVEIRIKPYGNNDWALDADLWIETREDYVFLDGAYQDDLPSRNQFVTAVNESFQALLKTGELVIENKNNIEMDR